MIGARSAGTTNIVRRMHSIHSSLRSSYMARSIAGMSGSMARAAAAR